MDRQPLTDRLGDRFLTEYGGAAAAYSLRALNGNGDNVVRVRRASDNDEQDFTASQVSDGTLESYCGVGDGFVETWYDQSGNGNDATQSVIGSQPKIVDGGSLVAGGMDFDGVDDYLLSSHILSSDDVLSLYAVGAFDDLTQRGRMAGDFFYVDISDNGGFVLEIKAFNQPNRTGGYGDDILFPHTALSFVTEGSESLFELQLASGSSSFYVNGSNVNTISATMNAEDGGSVLSIGAGTTGATAHIGQIKEIIIYNADKTSDMANIRGNINAHYNIYP